MHSIISFFTNQVNQYANNPLLWEKVKDGYSSLSYNDVLKMVEKLAVGFSSIGITAEEKVALLSEGRNLWLISELAVLSNRAITVPLSVKLEADNDLSFRLKHSESKVIIVSENQLSKIRALKNELAAINMVIVFSNEINLEEDEICIDKILEKGEEILKENPNAYQELIKNVSPDDIATITYTSGTTSQPKGIMLSHRNYTANVEQAFSFIDIPSYYKTLVILPWDHAFAHTVSLYAFMFKGGSIASVQTGKTTLETLKNIGTNIQEIKPHVLMSVPALAKNFKKSIIKGIEQKGKIISSLFKYALKLSVWYNGDGTDKGKGIKKIAYPLISLSKHLIFNKIKDNFGGNLKYFIGGGALLDIELQHFFYAIGIPMYQGYGLSEASPIISANTPQHHKLGTSGKVVNNLNIKICDSKGNSLPAFKSGEIVVQGENVMKGYWKNQEATKETIIDEWLYTGDLGYLDDENYLHVKGRFKSLLIASDGEKYSPEGIEEAIIDHCPLIEQVMLYNNQNPYTIAIIVPNIEKVKQLIKTNNEEEIHKVLIKINKEIQEFKSGGKHEGLFPQRWLPSTFAIAFEPFSEQNKLINSTMKMVRDKVVLLFEDEISNCYSLEGKNFINKKNIINITRLKERKS